MSAVPSAMAAITGAAGVDRSRTVAAYLRQCALWWDTRSVDRAARFDARVGVLERQAGATVQRGAW